MLQEQSYKLAQCDGFSIWRVGADRAEDVTCFVHGVYHERFAAHPDWDGPSELDKMLRDDRSTLPYSAIISAFDEAGRALATVRIIRKVPFRPLPTERDFGLDFTEIAKERDLEVHELFEIARFAKSDRAIVAAGLDERAGHQAVDRILEQAVRATAYDPQNAWCASIDNVVLQLLRKKGFVFDAVAPSTVYLGSDTTPALLPVSVWA
ncbi:MAG: hypothetical protein D6761_03110, partial [Candidatus Dadabacteria bacterium]